MKLRAGPSAVIFGAVVAYAALAVAMFWGIAPWSSTHLMGNGLTDPGQMTWFLQWTAYAVVHHLNPFHTTLIDYPSGVNLADNTGVPLIGLIATPITLWLGPIAALNLLLRLSLVVSSMAMYLLVRGRCRSAWPAFAGGLFYGFSPYVASHVVGATDHLDLAFVPLPCVMFWCVEQLVVRPRRRPVALGVLLGLTCAAQMLIAPEVLAECAVIGIIAVLVLALTHPSEIRARIGRVLVGTGAALVVFVPLSAYPIWWFLRGAGHLNGPVQPPALLQTFHGDLALSVLPAVPRLFSPGPLLTAGEHVNLGVRSELSGYLGIPLVACLIAFVVVWRRRNDVTVCAFLALVCYLFSLGPRLSVDGHIVRWLPLPDALLYRIPILSSTIPARFALETTLFVAVAFAVGLDCTLSEARALSKRHLRVLGQVGAVVLCAAVFIVAAPKVPIRSGKLAWQAAFPEAISRVAAGRPVLTFPYADPPFAQPMVWQAQAGLSYPLLGAYATVRGSKQSQFWPPLISPDYVQEFLGFANVGVMSHYGKLPVARNADALFCQFLTKYHVGAVAYYPRGKYPSKALRLFTAVLGSPTETVGHGKVWNTTGHCRAA